MNLKTCTKCKEEKQTLYFGIHKSRKDGLRSVCKSCNTKQACSYAKLNKDKITTYQKEYKSKNKLKINNQIKAIKERNKEYYDMVKNIWKENNKKKLTIYNQNRKAKKRNQTGKISPFISIKLLSLQKNKCANCNKDLIDSYHIDHITPLSLGGEHDDKNLELLCPKCNLRKSNKDPVAWANENGRLL
jgi:5-methylcytosine-specific restriction endonuclease McrA